MSYDLRIAVKVEGCEKMVDIGEPDNGWGTINGAIAALNSLRDYIYTRAEDIPIECLWVAW